MKRDWGLIRDLLEHLESLGFGQHWEARELPGHRREAVAYRSCSTRRNCSAASSIPGPARSNGWSTT